MSEITREKREQILEDAFMVLLACIAVIVHPIAILFRPRRLLMNNVGFMRAYSVVSKVETRLNACEANKQRLPEIINVFQHVEDQSLEVAFDMEPRPEDKKFQHVAAILISGPNFEAVGPWREDWEIIERCEHVLDKLMQAHLVTNDNI